jgi:radical SAM-linked protein
MPKPRIDPNAPGAIGRDEAFRYRITFAKTHEMRYTGHLDVQRAWERLIRRARLPLLFTRGYHPRARFNLASALPLGFLGEHEIAELYLVDEIPVEELLDRLRENAPPGIGIQAVERVASSRPALQTEIAASTYEVDLGPEVDLVELATRVRELLAAEALPRERRGKTYDLRPLVDGLEVVSSHRRLLMRLASRDGATGRPDEVLRALELDPAVVLVRRTRLLLDGGDAA